MKGFIKPAIMAVLIFAALMEVCLMLTQHIELWYWSFALVIAAGCTLGLVWLIGRLFHDIPHYDSNNPQFPPFSRGSEPVDSRLDPITPHRLID